MNGPVVLDITNVPTRNESPLVRSTPNGPDSTTGRTDSAMGRTDIRKTKVVAPPFMRTKAVTSNDEFSSLLNTIRRLQDCSKKDAQVCSNKY